MLNAIATICMTGKTEKRQFAAAGSILKNVKYIKGSKEDAHRGKRHMAKIFVVDDEESIRFSFSRMLTDAGYEVIAAGHSTDAKAILAANEFNVAVIDRLLMGRETGLELIKYIKEMQPSCETILVSAYPTRKSAAEALQYETFAYLNKPVKKEELCRVVKEAVRKGKARKDLKNRESIFRSLFNISPNPTAVCDLSGRVKFINPAFAALFGYEEKEVSGEPLPNIPYWDKDESESEFADLLAGKTVSERETKRLTKNGEAIHVIISKSVHLNSRKSPNEILIIMRDKTDVMKIQEQLCLSLIGRRESRSRERCF